MSHYWKQSLWLGGVYWIISLVLWNIATIESNLTDVAISVLLLLFLIPMNWIQPIRWIDNVCKKIPITSTFLVAIGWAPYFAGVVFVISTIAALLIFAFNEPTGYRMFFSWFNILIYIGYLRIGCMGIATLGAAVAVFVFKRSIVGCLDKRFKLVDVSGCDNQAVETSVEEKVSDSKKISKAKKVENKVPKKVTAKKQVKTKTKVKTEAKVKTKADKKVVKSKKI